MKQYDNEGREGANCTAYEMDYLAAEEWLCQTGEVIERGCISCKHFNGIKCSKEEL